MLLKYFQQEETEALLVNKLSFIQKMNAQQIYRIIMFAAYLRFS
jgi:hypothetical protein